MFPSWASWEGGNVAPGAYRELALVATIDPLRLIPPLYEPYRSELDGERLIVGVPPAILAKGPLSVPLPVADPGPEASFSSPATNLLNVAHTDPETLSMLGLEIQEADSPFGDDFNRLLRSSRADTRSAWWYGDLRV